MKLADRMRQSIRRRSGQVVLRSDLAPLGSSSQVSEALRTLQQNGELLRLGVGVYAKARRDEATQAVVPMVDSQTLGREVARKLHAQVAEAGDGTVVLDTGDRRLSRKLSLGEQPVHYVNSRSRRSTQPVRAQSAEPGAWPTTDVASYVRALATRHQVRYLATPADHWAETVTRLAGDEVRSGPVQDLLVALKRAGKLSKADMACLLVNYLRERKQGV